VKYKTNIQHPTGVAIHEDEIYISGNGWQRKLMILDFKTGTKLREFTPDTNPHSLTIDNDEIFLIESSSHRISVYDRKTTELRYRFGEQGTGDGKLQRYSSFLSFSQDELFVGNSHKFKIQVFDRKGSFKRKFIYKKPQPKPRKEKNGGEFQVAFGDVMGMAVGKDVYVMDRQRKRIAIYTRDGDFVKHFRVEGSDGPQYGHIALWKDELYVYCPADHKLRVFI